VQHQINNEFLSLILFIEEASFANVLQTCIICITDRTRIRRLREVDRQRQWSVNVWCGIIGDKLIGPYFINGRLNNIKYDNFIRNDLEILLEDVQLNICQVIWYQHDGCPAHYGRNSYTQ